MGHLPYNIIVSIFGAKLTPCGIPLRAGDCSGVFISQAAHGAVRGVREKGGGRCEHRVNSPCSLSTNAYPLIYLFVFVILPRNNAKYVYAPEVGLCIHYIGIAWLLEICH